MKRLILLPLLLTLLLASCSKSKKYNSYREAIEACRKWSIKGGTYELTNPEFTNWSTDPDFPSYKEEVYLIPLRWCKEEKMTNQILGLQISDRKKDSKWFYKKRCWDYCDRPTYSQKDNSKVKGNFYY